MNKYTLINTSLFSAASVLLSSCALDPNYRAYKEQQAASATADVAAAATAATSNPYGIPQSSGEVGTYTPTPAPSAASAPYQPIPGVSQSTTPSYTPAPTYVAPSSSLGGNSHQVVAGDSLWSLAKKYGSTVESIQAANGLTTDLIRTGQTLVIPGN